MRAKKNTPEAKKHGHIKNNFHTVEQPGFSTSFYLSGEEVATLTAYLQSQNETVNKTSLGVQARLWFHEMMEARKNEFSKSPEIGKENT